VGIPKFFGILTETYAPPILFEPGEKYEYKQPWLRRLQVLWKSLWEKISWLLANEWIFSTVGMKSYR